MVSREELIERLWPTNTFMDFNLGLNKAVNRLGEALEDTAERPRFIFSERGDLVFRTTLPLQETPCNNFIRGGHRFGAPWLATQLQLFSD
jgi:hypothetical protein